MYVLSFFDNLLTVQPSEHTLYSSIFKNQKLIGDLNNRNQVIAFYELYLVRINVFVKWRIVEQTRHCNYLGSNTSYDEAHDIGQRSQSKQITLDINDKTTLILVNACWLLSLSTPNIILTYTRRTLLI